MTTQKQGNARYSLESINITLKLLNMVIHSDLSMNLTTLSKRAKITKNKAFRILNTLEEHDVIEKDPMGRYAIGTAAFGAARKIISKDSMLTRIRPVMKKLSETVNEAVYFARRSGEQLTLAEMVDCRQVIKAASFVGKSLTATQSCSPSVQDRTDNLSRGVTVSSGGIDPDITTVSVEIADHSGQSIGSLVVLAPSFRLSPVVIEAEIIPALIEAARQSPLLDAVVGRARSLSADPPCLANHDAHKDGATNMLVPARWGRSEKTMGFMAESV